MMPTLLLTLTFNLHLLLIVYYQQIEIIGNHEFHGENNHIFDQMLFTAKLLIFLSIIIYSCKFLLHMSFCSCESCWWEGTNHELEEEEEEERIRRMKRRVHVCCTTEGPDWLECMREWTPAASQSLQDAQHHTYTCSEREGDVRWRQDRSSGEFKLSAD